MASIRTSRIMRDLADFGPVSGLILSGHDDSLDNVEVSILSSVDGVSTSFVGTPFEGGTYKMRMNLPPTFPYKSPEIFLETPVWHPNVAASDGLICMSLLDDDWHSGTTLIEYADGVRWLLSNPNPNSPLNARAANMFVNKKAMYDLNATLWARIHAGGTKPAGYLDERLEILTAMGLTPTAAIREGAQWFWDVQKILDLM